MPKKANKYCPFQVAIMEPGDDLSVVFCHEITFQRVEDYSAMELRDRTGGLMKAVNSLFVIQVKLNPEFEL